MESKTFKIIALGCRTNQYEAQALRDQLLALGHREANFGEKAELCFVNTCTVTEGADSDSRREIRRLIRQNPKAKMVVTGCLAERTPDQLKAIAGIDFVIPNARKEKTLSLLFPEENIPSFSIKSFLGHTRAFVKVQEGCNSFCSYCIIPYVRGRSRSRKLPEVVEEVKGLVGAGYKEIVITGINVGDFDGGEDKKLSDLLFELDHIEGLKRLRLSSIDPTDIDESFLQIMKEAHHLSHSLHLVLQSGSNTILKQMNRRYRRELFLEKVEALRSLDPDFTLTTDVIVGFPGETESDFEESCSIVSQVGFAKVHIFPYSPREKTRASRFPNRVSNEIIQRRKQQLCHIAEESASLFCRRFVGREMEILTEGNMGHTDNFLAVSLAPLDLLPNQLIRVKIKENTKEGLLLGELL